MRAGQLVAGALVVALATASSAAQSGPSGFETSMATIDRLMDAGAWDDAYEHMQVLLADPDAHAEVLAELPRVNDVLARSFFRLTHEEVSLEDLIAGELLSYDKRSGKIKVRYRKDPDEAARIHKVADGNAIVEELLQLLGNSTLAGGDFSFARGVPVHPLHFSGQYTVEIQGELPEEGGNNLAFFFGSPRFLVGIQDDLAYQVDFGVARSKKYSYGGDWADGKITRLEGKHSETLDSSDQTPLKFGKKYTIKVNVSASKITASCNGKTFLSAKKPDDVYGQFGFSRCPNVSEMLITGTANTSWLEGLADAREQAAWQQFLEDYDPKEHVPDWLEPHVEKAEVAGSVSIFDEAPGEMPEWEQLEELAKLEQRGRLDEAVKTLETIEAEGDAEGARRHFLSLALAGAGRVDAALEHNDAVREAYPDFLPARILRAQLLAAQDLGEQARAELAALIEQRGDEPSLHVELARQFLAEGALASAHTVIDAAIEDGIAATDLSGIRAALNRAERGPQWSHPFEFKSRNYLVVSDLSAKVASEAGQTLEQSLAMYTSLFGRAAGGSEDPDAYLVYLFAGQSGYLAYTRDLFGAAQTNTAGLYTSALKQLLLWNLPDKDMLLGTIRHEGLHQYLDRLLGPVPIWFNEGLAEYFETAELVRGRWEPGAPVKAHVKLLGSKGTTWTPLAELVAMRPARFMHDPGVHYAESWALIHTLLHGDRDGKRLFEAYFDALAAGLDQDAAKERAFGETDFGELQRSVQAHLREL